MFTGTQQCPSCNEELPGDLGLHATSPVAAAAQCPYCGSTVKLEKPTVEVPEVSPEEAASFAGGAFEQARRSLPDSDEEETEDAPEEVEEGGLAAARAKMREAGQD